jgi:hypothetical protein
MMAISHRYSLVRQIVWATTLATGFGTVWFVLVAWLATAIQESWQGSGRRWPHREQLVIRSDGTPLIELYQWDELSRLTTTYRDLKGVAQKSTETTELIAAIFMPGEHPPAGRFAGEPSWLERLKYFVNDREPNAAWYFVHDGKPEGAGYFVGYDRVSHQRIGFIGLSGARSDPVPAGEQIPGVQSHLSDQSQWSSAPQWIFWNRNAEFRADGFDLPPRLVYVPSGKQLRVVDLAAGTITTIFEAPEAIESPGVATVTNLTNRSGGKPEREQPVLVRTRQFIYALDRSHKVVRRFTIPEEIDPRSAVSWYEIPAGQAIAVFSDWSTYHSLLYRIGADGTILERSEVALQQGTVSSSEASTLVVEFLGLPSPAFIGVIQPLILMGPDPAHSYLAALTTLITKLWPALLGVIALSVLLAIIAWRRCVSFGLSWRERVAWPVFVLVLGLPAFAGFLLSRRWVVRWPCSTCHARVPRDRDECTKCGTRFPDPALLGIEIFA